MKIFELDGEIVTELSLIEANIEANNDDVLLEWIKICKVGDKFYEALPHSVLIRVE